MVTTRSQVRAGRGFTVPMQSMNRMRRARRWTKRYRPGDPGRRHRIKDGQPKTQHVVSYTRRT